LKRQNSLVAERHALVGALAHVLLLQASGQLGVELSQPLALRLLAARPLLLADLWLQAVRWKVKEPKRVTEAQQVFVCGV
jgi:hypothetical protein